MMNIEGAFQANRRLMEQAGMLIRAVRAQNYYLMAQLQKEMIIGLQIILQEKDLYQAYFQADFLETTLVSILKALLEAQEQGDHTLYADLVHLELIPFLQALQASVYDKEGILLEKQAIENTRNFIKETNLELFETLEKIADPSQEEYHVVPAATGALTVQIRSKKSRFYLHSNVDPSEEADLLVEQYFDSHCRHYIVYGLGFGYHIAALNRRCFQSAVIDVYESDLNMIKLASAYGLPEDMLTENVHIHHDLYCRQIAGTLNNTPVIFGKTGMIDILEDHDIAQLFIHYPSVRNIRNEALEESFDKFMAKESSIRNNKDRMLINFRENKNHYSHYVDELETVFSGKDVYLVAAGPSLDQNIDHLKEIDRSRSIILAVGTVFKKLIRKQIQPDFVVFLDPGERTYGHIEGLEDQNIPILVASTAYRKIAEHYAGPAYLVCQKGYEPAERLAAEKGYRLYETGGSVSTIALDIAIRSGASRIICMGLDLAYPNSLSHAEGTMDRQVCDMGDAYTVKSFDGGQVQTSNLFLIYREWIEKRIAREKTCSFYNTSVGGAYITGMIHCMIEEVRRDGL